MDQFGRRLAMHQLAASQACPCVARPQPRVTAVLWPVASCLEVLGQGAANPIGPMVWLPFSVSLHVRGLDEHLVERLRPSLTAGADEGPWGPLRRYTRGASCVFGNE